MGLGAGTVELRVEFDPFFHAHFEKVARAAALVTRDAAARPGPRAGGVHATARAMGHDGVGARSERPSV